MTLFVNSPISWQAVPYYMTYNATEVRPDGADPNPMISSLATIAVIERRPLLQDCLARLINQKLDAKVVPLGSVDEFLVHPDRDRISLVIFCDSILAASSDAWSNFRLLVDNANDVPVVVSSESDDPSTIIEALNLGARGYVPTSTKFEILIEVLRLVLAGGMFAPPQSLLQAASQKSSPEVETPPGAELTLRQLAIINALRQGKSNKVIAYELSMCESTVKVHMRNIMKKLGVRNRTEVALMAAQLLADRNS